MLGDRSKLYGNADALPDVVVGAWLKVSTLFCLAMGSSADDSGDALPKITMFGFVDPLIADLSLVTAVVGELFVLAVSNTTLWPFTPPDLLTTVTPALASSVSVWTFVFK